MEQLSERQEYILGLIVREYVETAQPVGSKNLVEKYQLDFSSATTRNDMQTLTEAGYLRQPHTSAGRVPTEDGYRYFVQRLIGNNDLSNADKRTINHQFFQARGDITQWMRLAASILARHSSAASLVTAPTTERVLFRRLELIPIQGQKVLLVLVLQGGKVEQQFLSLEEPFSQDDLARTANQLNAELSGAEVSTVESKSALMGPLPQAIAAVVTGLMHRSNVLTPAEIVHDGLTNVLSQPEFADPALASRTLHMLEENTLLHDFLAQALNSEIGGVQVVIGGEGDWEDLRDCSLVIARYGSPGLATGAIGVIGPTRLAYGPTISAVRYVSSVMGELVSESLTD